MNYRLITVALACASLALPPSAAHALTIDEAHRLARANYPAIKQYSLISQSREFSVANAAKAWLPQVSLAGRATYQSDVTKMPIDASKLGINYEGLSCDQYDAHVSIDQSIYDGGATAARKRELQAQASVEEKQNAVTLYAVRQRVDQLYFGILLLDEQLAQNAVYQNDLALGRKSISAMIKGGTASQTDADAVSVQILQARQQEKSMRAVRRSYLDMLSTFTGTPLSESDTLAKPAATLPQADGSQRPELSVFAARERLLDTQRRSLDVALRPRLAAFAQAGAGEPALNMLKNGWDTYYKIGLSLTWNFGALYTRKNDKRLLDTQRASVDADRETFLFNQRLQQRQTNGQIASCQSLLQHDDEIISLRESIRSKSEKRVAAGTESVNDMLRDINAVADARLQKALHEVQLLQQIYELKNINND